MERLLSFRSKHYPDPPNQLGFCKKAQTADHIFSLHNHLLRKQNVFGCFIDYQKAFDSVSREALLWKLSKLGISGNCFKCIFYMNRNSSAKPKPIGKISERLEVLVSTEQGHPMFPELFIGYLLDLSTELSHHEQLQLPELNELPISYLL